MEDVRITPEVTAPTRLRDERLTAGLIAQYIHELSGRHAADRAPVRDSGGA
jgi:hypothetical protein